MGARTVAVVSSVVLAVAALAAQRPSTGTARISGMIQVDDGSRAPLRGAIVTISAPELLGPRSAITDAAGAFAFANLPAGRFALTATKAPFLTMAYGAGRPGRQGTSISIAANQEVKDVVVRLPRGCVITGTLRDHTGNPIEGVTVTATKPGPSPTRTSMVSTLPSATTDDRGVYRIFGLMPGEYLVAASFRLVGSGELSMPTTAEIDRRFAELGRVSGPGLAGGGAPPVPGARATEAARTPGYALAPTFFPGTTDPATATPVAVTSGEERTADFVIAPVRAGTVEGVIRMEDGSPLPTVLPALEARGPAMPLTFGSAPALIVRPTATDGRFKFSGVTPGTYFLTAATQGAARGVGDPPAPRRYAITEITARGEDLSGIVLTLESGQRLSGVVKFEGATPPPADLTKIRLTATSNRPQAGLAGLGLSLPQTAAGAVAADGSFVIPGLVPGPYTISLIGLSGGWVMRSAQVNGKDALDVPFEVVSGSDINGAIVTFSDKRSELSGTLRTAANAPATDYFVVVFPTDRAAWTAARRVQSARPASDGVYAMKDLAPGEYYLAALTDVTADDLKDVSFLAQMVAGAIKVVIGDGEKKVQDLKVGR